MHCPSSMSIGKDERFKTRPLTPSERIGHHDKGNYVKVMRKCQPRSVFSRAPRQICATTFDSKYRTIIRKGLAFLH
jgi:hypothetical protein